MRKKGKEYSFSFLENIATKINISTSLLRKKIKFEQF